MTAWQPARRFAPWGLAIACAAAAGWARARAESVRPAALASVQDVPPISADVLRPLTFGMRAWAADMAFLEAVQVFGARRPKDPEELVRRSDVALTNLLRYTTDLDEKFASAYRFAGSVLPRETRDNKVYNVLVAANLLEKGTRERPDVWQIPFQLGFLESYYLGHMEQAAGHLALAARQQGAPSYLALLATRVAADAGNLNTAQQLAETMAGEAEDESARKEWDDRLVELKMERDLRAIEDAAARYRQREGKAAPGLRALVAAGDLSQVPPEPHGGRYELDPATGEARSSVAPRLRVRGRRGTQAGLEVR